MGVFAILKAYAFVQGIKQQFVFGCIAYMISLSILWGLMCSPFVSADSSGLGFEVAGLATFVRYRW